MSQLDALTLAANVRRRLVDFTVDNQYVRDDRLRAILRRLWSGPQESGGLVGDLWVEGAFPAESCSDTTAHLVERGILHPRLAALLDQNGAFPNGRPLFTHQREAVLAEAETRATSARKALVVTAPTGAGKTESFLLPVLNDLYSTGRGAGNGIRALILYPMNALVNDQVERLDAWLQNQREVTLFHFTSETPEDRAAAARMGIELKPGCRCWTRQQARGLEDASGGPVAAGAPRGCAPDILVTNYSMLEYMLCRPQDAVFFGSALRSIVLDEAHLYGGTMAAEISLLLRRVTQRCGVSPERVFGVATSATLGGSEDDLRGFVGTIFSKAPDDVRVIAGQRRRMRLAGRQSPAQPPQADAVAQASLGGPTIALDGRGDAELATSAAQCDHLASALCLFTDARAVSDARRAAGDKPAVMLHDALAHAPLIHEVEQILWDRRIMRLSLLAEELWASSDETSQEATVRLLQFGACARNTLDSYPVIPHRLHMLARSTAGVGVCLNANCTGPADNQIANLGCVSAEVQDRCRSCGSAMAAVWRCGECGEWGLAVIIDGPAYRPATGAGRDRDAAPHVVLFTVRPLPNVPLVNVAPDGTRDGHGGAGVGLWKVSECPICGADAGRAWEPISDYHGSPLSLSIVAETVLAGLPAYAGINEHLPARGRRLLAFSDSRREAAKLGPQLRNRHEIQVMRAAIVRCVESMSPVDAETLADIRDEIAVLDARLRSGEGTPAQRARWTRERDDKRRDLQAAQSGGTVAEWIEQLKGQDAVAEILDVPSAGTHAASEWTRDEWESNRREVGARLRAYLGRELAGYTPGQRSAESLGLVEVAYPGLSDAQLPAEIAGTLGLAERTAVSNVWPDLLASLCDTLRNAGAITIGTADDDEEYEFGGALVGRWCAKNGGDQSLDETFVGRTELQRRRAFVRRVLQRCGWSEEFAKRDEVDVLSIAFDQLVGIARSGASWLEQEDKAGAVTIRLRFPGLSLRKPAQLYECRTSGNVYPRSVRGCSPWSAKSNLEPVSAAYLDKSARLGRLRYELRNDAVFSTGLWSEEHSAQLAPEENRRIQFLFKAGIRNVLSSTTTMELGIDIGGLQGSLMANVPPAKANYLQRAGRSGRRADGSSLVATFARARPFDQEVFRRFDWFLESSLRPPRALERERVVLRHARALLLGEFFRSVYPPNQRVGAMRAFGHMGDFAGVQLPGYWKDGPQPAAQSRPAADFAVHAPWWRAGQNLPLDVRFGDYLVWLRGQDTCPESVSVRDLLWDTCVANAAEDWCQFMTNVAAEFRSAMDGWRTAYAEVLSGWQEVPESASQKRQCNAIRYQLSALYETTVIETLADSQFLPRYGFPIGTQRLRVIVPDARGGRVREEDQYRLERSGILALREYVPGSQLVVGGRRVTSHGILKHWSGANFDNYIGLRGTWARCANEHFFYTTSRQIGLCPVCRAEPAENGQMLIPRHGFTTAVWDPPKLRWDVDRVGHVHVETVSFAQRDVPYEERADFAEVAGAAALYREDGQLLVFNAGDKGCGFAICVNCGYATSEEKAGGAGALNLPNEFKRHPPLMARSRSLRCHRNDQEQPLRNQTLAAEQPTDVLMVDLSAPLGGRSGDRALMLTLGHAMANAGARILDMDSRELGVLLAPSPSHGAGFGVVLYDNVPGGAGHVRSLLELGRPWLEEALALMFVDPAHHSRCDTACLDCLLTFDAQDAHGRGELRRREAYDVLDALLAGTPIPVAPATTVATPVSTVPPAHGSVEQRLAAARARRRAR